MIEDFIKVRQEIDFENVKRYIIKNSYIKEARYFRTCSLA